MKKVLTLYKQYYEVPDEISDKAVISHLLVITLFYFVLGFTMSQVIIYLVG